MKDTDKVTLTMGQLKKLVKESKGIITDSIEEIDLDELEESPIAKLGYKILNNINEHNFISEMRFKWYDVEDINQARNTATLYWQTQGGFDSFEFDEFMDEVKRVAGKLKKSDFKGVKLPITFKVEAESRDGKYYGYETERLKLPL